MKRYYKICSGLIGFIIVLGLCLYQLSCLAVIFFTTRSEGNGDNYDAMLLKEDEGWSIVGLLFLLLFYMLFLLPPLLLLFYPWLKLFFAMVRNRIRPDYYGLFIGKSKVTRFISVLLAILNFCTIIWFTWDISIESSRISNWNYEHALCSDNSIIYIGYILGIIVFWGFIHLAHGGFHYVILKNK